MAGEEPDPAELHRLGPSSLSPLARGGAPRRREDGGSRERRRPRLPVAIAAGDEGDAARRGGT